MRAALVVGVVGVAMVAETARAEDPCQCTEPGYGAYLSSLRFAGAPTNARFFGVVAERLRDETTGDELPLRAVPTGDGRTSWFIPEQPLVAGHEHTYGSVPFTVGAGPDTMAPTFSSVRGRSTPVEELCGQYLSSYVDVEGFRDATTTLEGAVKRIDLEGRGVRRTVYVTGTGPISQLAGDGDRAWSCTNIDDGLRSGSELSAVVTAYDWAGNASPPSERVSLRFQLHGFDGAGCSVVPGGRVGVSPGGALVCALLVALLAWGRARRRRAPAELHPGRE